MAVTPIGQANYANASNVTNFVDLIAYSNSVSEGWFGVGMLISLFAIISVSLFMSGRGREAFVAGSFITLLVGILMYIAQITTLLVLVICIVAFFGSALLFHAKDRS